MRQYLFSYLLYTVTHYNNLQRKGIIFMNSEKIGIVISNNETTDEIFSCVSSVLSSSLDNYDIIVIDQTNDDSFQKTLMNTFTDQIHLLIEQETNNMTGLLAGFQYVLEHDYKYLCSLPKNITVDNKALFLMRKYLSEHEDVGMVGGKVLHKHMPDYIQQYGITVDFKHFKASSLYADLPDNSAIPNIVYCDTLSLCGVMMPVDFVKEVGIPSHIYYLHWDDIEWGFRFKQAGYKVVALGDARMFHHSNTVLRCDTTAEEYYFTRNCLRFFMQYTKPENCTKMSIVLLREIFDAFYLHRMSQAHNMAQADIDALMDAIHGITGKAPENRILENDEKGLGFVTFFEEQTFLYLENDDPFLEEVIRQVNPDIIFLAAPTENAVTIKKCDSILQIKDIKDQEIYLDQSFHLLATKEDMEAIKDYEHSLQLFLYMMQPMLLRKIVETREIEL